MAGDSSTSKPSKATAQTSDAPPPPRAASSRNEAGPASSTRTRPLEPQRRLPRNEDPRGVRASETRPRSDPSAPTLVQTRLAQTRLVQTPWQRLRAFARPPRRLKVTREGKFFVGITLGVGFAAINTANNLLYLLLGMLLALIVVSGLMSEVSLRDLTVVRRLPLRAQVGRAHLVEIEVFNHKRRVPSYAIEVEDLRFGQPADKRCFFLKISPKSAQVAAYRRTPSKRGRDLHVGFRIATRFPFGLFEKSREIDAEGDLIIYPAVDPVQLAPAPPGRTPGGDGTIGRGYGDEYLGLKSMRQGEDPRDIHWRKSAAAGQLVMRERAREARPDISLALDVVRPKASGDEWEVAFERRVRDVASRAVAHLKRGDSVAIRTSVGGCARSDRTAGADPVLRYLALVQPVVNAARASTPAPPSDAANTIATATATATAT